MIPQQMIKSQKRLLYKKTSLIFVYPFFTARNLTIVEDNPKFPIIDTSKMVILI